MQKVKDIHADRVSLLGFYSHAHPSDIMNNRIQQAVKLLEENNIDVNFI